MANIQITQLPASSPLTGSEVVPVVQNGVTVRTTTGAIAAASQTGYSYITVNQEPNLANSRALQGGLGIGLTDDGPQNPLTIELNGASGSLEGAGVGFISKTSGSNVVARTFTAIGGGVSITNGDGIAGNPQISAAGVLQEIVGLTGTGILALNNTAFVTMLQIQGTANQINVASGAGPSDPTISIAANPVLPGSEGVVVPKGDTAARAPLPESGEFRFNSELGVFEGYLGSSWAQFATGSGSGTVTSVGVSANGTGLTTSGSPITSNGTITISGTLLANHGGTGFDTYTSGDMLYANSTDTFAKLAIGNASDILIVSNSAPTWVAISSISIGNAAYASLAGIANNLANGAANQIAYQTGANATSFITAPNTASTFLSWNGSNFTWSAVAGAGTVTSVDANGGTTGLTFTGGPITASGNLTLSGTLAITAGGTGATDAANARSNLGLGTMATQNANNVSITGGTVNVSRLQSTDGIVVAGNISSPTFIQMNTSPGTVTLTAGRMWWDATGTLNIGMGNGNVTQQVGEELFVYGKASSAISGQTILQAVYKTGTVGASGVITFAPTVAGITDGFSIIGVGTEDIPNNGFGRVTAFGVVHGVDTTGSTYGETWANNDDIWYNPVTGGLTKNKPVAPNIKVQVGTVINAGSGGSGSFQVQLNPGSVLGGTDANVQFGNLSNNQLIQYNSSLQYWTNVDAANVTVGNISGTLAVSNGGTGSNATPTSGQLLIGNNTGFTLATITAGANINITNGPGTITISSTGGGGGSSNVSANTAYAYAWFIS